MDVKPRHSDHNLTNLHLIIVEDDFVVAQSLSDLLEAFGAKDVEMASNIDQAIDKINKQRFDIAILDVNLLGGSVEPVALRLKEQGVPFLFVTGYASQDMLPASMQDHAVLLKPVNPEEMLTMITKLVGIEQ
ncbi:response regulator [Poriferisphaera sp. WC338]|uniref:response regulator n=1 Tax=Poriferisphaera sp. WC338 TaxID=3425129 RepID=UPI003D8185DA